MYKVSLNQMRTFFEVLFLGIIVNHDSYHVFLAIASTMFAYFISCSIFKSKVGKWIFFTPFSIMVCQLSVTIKKAVMDVGFKQVLRENPFGVLFGDMVYGIKAVYVTIGKIFGAFYEAWGLDAYSSIESLNYRFFTILIMLIVMTYFLLKQKTAMVKEYGGE